MFSVKFKGPHDPNDNNTANKGVVVMGLHVNESFASFLLCWLKDVIIVLEWFFAFHETYAENKVYLVVLSST